MIRITSLVAGLMLAFGIAHARSIDDAAIADTNNTSDWLAYGRTHDEQRFSPLDAINDRNVSGLTLDWFLELPDATGLTATPLVKDGVLFFVSSRNVAHAVDAVTGKPLWKFDPEVCARPHACGLPARQPRHACVQGLVRPAAGITASLPSSAN